MNQCFRLTLPISFLLFSLILNGQQVLVRQVKLTKFSLQSSSLVKQEGNLLSDINYKETCHWYPVQVPCTVLKGLVENQIYPDPHLGMNNMLIPDASDSFNSRYNLEQFSYLPNDPNPWKKPYWYKTVFIIPAGDRRRHFQLIFKGINYRAEVWVNGKLIADSSAMAGMFAEYSFDITDNVKIGSANGLAVKIFPLDFPGLPSTEQLKALGDFYPNGGPTGDIGKNVTMLCSVGWDWMPPVRDRNIGIWQPVFLRTTGAVTITQPQIKTELDDSKSAKLSLHLLLFNRSRDIEKGKLLVRIVPENFSGPAIECSKEVMVGALSAKDVDLNSGNTTCLNIIRPQLWWPNGYGKPNLYRIHIQFNNGNIISDDTSFLIGIRTVSSKTVTVNGSLRRDFYVNDKKVHLNGGAWVPDMMLDRDSSRYDYELHLCQNANVNLVRIWGGGIAPPDIFFDIADRYGLMVWQDFWVTGDTQGEFKGSADWPFQGNVFIRNVISTICRIRNHPSLLVWTGGNEGHARKELYDAMRNNVAMLDGTRPFIPSSSGFAKLPVGWEGSWPDNQSSGVYSGGPYSWKDPAEYFRLADHSKDWVFKDETGLPSQPPFNSLLKIIANLSWDTTLPYPLNNSWGYHDACTGAGRYDLYYQEMVKRFGRPTDLEDFSRKMQVLNSIGYRGIFEAAGHKLNETGGVMLWKLNAALPSVIWQIYDWYLEPNAGYYSMQNACEPVHIQLNANDSSVVAVNRTYFPVSGIYAGIDIYDERGKHLYHEKKPVSLLESDVKSVSNISQIIRGNHGVTFIILNLLNALGVSISHNAYWMAPAQDYSSLTSMKKAKVSISLLHHISFPGKDPQWTVKLENVSQNVAFFINPQLFCNEEEVMPSFWSANYITLAPHESAVLKLSAPAGKLKEGPIFIKLDGWNLEEKMRIHL